MSKSSCSDARSMAAPFWLSVSADLSLFTSVEEVSDSKKVVSLLKMLERGVSAVGEACPSGLREKERERMFAAVVSQLSSGLSYLSSSCNSFSTVSAGSAPPEEDAVFSTN